MANRKSDLSTGEQGGKDRFHIFRPDTVALHGGMDEIVHHFRRHCFIGIKKGCRDIEQRNIFQFLQRLKYFVVYFTDADALHIIGSFAARE